MAKPTSTFRSLHCLHHQISYPEVNVKQLRQVEHQAVTPVSLRDLSDLQVGISLPELMEYLPAM